jgi:hypothetical protein
MSHPIRLIWAVALAAGCVESVSKGSSVSKGEGGSEPADASPDTGERAEVGPVDRPADLPPDAGPDAPGLPDGTARDAAAELPRLPLGQPCALDGECGSGHCVSRVCCATICPAGTPPCGQDGTCDGNGRCRAPATETACGEEKCSSGSFTPAPRCDGTGRCGSATAVACASNLCQGTRCAGACGPSVPCADGLYCEANGQCQPKKVGGTRCDTDGECATGHCAEHVCCDTACGTPCRSCLATHTGGRDGQCAAVRAGADPYDSCQATAASSCLNDGFCDGQGACRQHPPATPCRSEACVDGAGGSSYTPAGACNGAGRCDVGAGKPCDPYVCGGSKCKDSCSTKGDCQGGHYCAAPRCVQQKAFGQVCAAPDECASGTCGGYEVGARSGRCCQSCMCPQPSAGNLLAQAGFDQSMTSWTIALTSAGPGRAEIRWTSALDRDDCQYSGSAEIVLGDQRDGLFYQCLPASNGQTYYFGGYFRAPSLPEPMTNGVPWQASCSLVFYTTMAGCKAAADQRFMFRQAQQSVRLYEFYYVANQWTSFGNSATNSMNGQAVALECEGLDDGAPTTDLHFDRLYVSTGSARY